jgi:hypothetical protein
VSYMAYMFVLITKKPKNMTDVYVSLSFLFSLLLWKLITHLQLVIKYAVIVNVVFFDGALNFQNAGEILVNRHPHITVGSITEQILTLFSYNALKKTIHVKDIC